jgi:uncharacterized protein (DUF305 family)
VTDPTDLAAPPAADADEPSDAEAVDRRPPVAVLIAFAIALAFLAAAVTYWWMQRPDDPSAVDIGFYDDMTSHHLQAIDIAHAYLRRGEDSLMRSMAEEVDFFQTGDIRVMQDALTEWGETGSPDVAMDWMGMPVPQDQQPGMATAEDLAALERARGRELDDLFSRLLIDHHAGGLHMAQGAADSADLTSVRELAAAIAAGQQAEIGEINFARTEIGLPEYRP